MKRIIIVILLALSMTGLSQSALAFTPDVNAYLENQREVLTLVNKERAKVGIQPLRMAEPAAIMAAMVRAYEISTRFTHTRPDGSGVQALLFDYGIWCRRYGENLAYGFNSPTAVMKGWMRSRSHMTNVLEPEYTMLAVGIYRANGVRYWVQVFLTD